MERTSIHRNALISRTVKLTESVQSKEQRRDVERRWVKPENGNQIDITTDTGVKYDEAIIGSKIWNETGRVNLLPGVPCEISYCTIGTTARWTVRSHHGRECEHGIDDSGADDGFPFRHLTKVILEEFQVILKVPPIPRRCINN